MEKINTTATKIVLLLITNLAVFAAAFSGAELNQRDRLLIERSPAVTPHAPKITPDGFCRLVFGESTSEVNCAQKHFEPGHEVSRQQLIVARDEVAGLSLAYRAMSSTLAIQTSVEAIRLVNIANQRADFLYALSTKPPAEVGYFDYFNALLIGQGISYNPFSNTFKPLPNDIGRYLLNSGSVSRELQILSFCNRIGLLAFGTVVSLLIFSSIARQLRATGVALVTGILFFNLIGLMVARDASINFGNYSSYFAINPLRNIFPRQLLISALCFTVFAYSTWIISRPTTPNFFHLSKPSYKWLAVIAPFTSMATYATAGVPIGAEFLKISACFLCALLITRYGRILELTQNHIGINKILNRKQPINAHSTNLQKAETLSASGEHKRFLLKKIILMPAGLTVAFLGSALLFSDLGGTLVAGLVTFFSFFVLFGTKFAWIAAIPSSMAIALLFLFSDKVRGRVELMQDPMRADISDFARLDEFLASATSSGYGLNQIKWCSNDGVCLPLQSLSDYMPTLLTGALGKEFSLLFIGLSCATMLALCVKCFLLSWDFRFSERVTAMTASLLCLAASLQALVTALGNWRMIPLTGLGYPFLSIGFSSSLSASLGLGLAIGIVFKKR